MNWMWGFIMGFNRTRGILSLVTVSLGLVVACDYSLDNYNPSSSSTVYNLTIADLINDTPADAEKTDTTFQLKATGEVEFGCDYQAALANSSTTGNAEIIGVDVLDKNEARIAVFTTPSSPMIIVGVKMRFAQAVGANLTGTFQVLYRGVEVNGNPASGPLWESESKTLIAGSNTSEVRFACIKKDAQNNPTTEPCLVTRSSSHPFEMPNLSLIVVPNITGGSNGANYISMAKTDQDSEKPGSEIIACNGLSPYKISGNSGTSWQSPSLGSENRRGYFKVVAATHAPSASGHWIVDAGSRAEWQMNTFGITETPSKLEGTVTYDVGASDDATPTYTQLNLTKAQVQALENVVGRYFFVKVNLSISGPPYYKRAEVTEATIEAKPVQ